MATSFHLCCSCYYNLATLYFYSYYMVLQWRIKMEANRLFQVSACSAASCRPLTLQCSQRVSWRLATACKIYRSYLKLWPSLTHVVFNELLNPDVTLFSLPCSTGIVQNAPIRVDWSVVCSRWGNDVTRLNALFTSSWSEKRLMGFVRQKRLQNSPVFCICVVTKCQHHNDIVSASRFGG